MFAYAVRPLPANGVCSASVEQKLNQVSAKDEPSLNSSWTAERPYNNVEENVQDGLSRSRESSNQSEKAREISVSRSKPASTAGQKISPVKNARKLGMLQNFAQLIVLKLLVLIQLVQELFGTT